MKQKTQSDSVVIIYRAIFWQKSTVIVAHTTLTNQNTMAIHYFRGVATQAHNYYRGVATQARNGPEGLSESPRSSEDHVMVHDVDLEDSSEKHPTNVKATAVTVLKLLTVILVLALIFAGVIIWCGFFPNMIAERSENKTATSVGGISGNIVTQPGVPNPTAISNFSNNPMRSHNNSVPIRECHSVQNSWTISDSFPPFKLISRVLKGNSQNNVEEQSQNNFSQSQSNFVQSQNPFAEIHDLVPIIARCACEKVLRDGLGKLGFPHFPIRWIKSDPDKLELFNMLAGAKARAGACLWNDSSSKADGTQNSTQNVQNSTLENTAATVKITGAASSSCHAVEDSRMVAVHEQKSVSAKKQRSDSRRAGKQQVHEPRESEGQQVQQQQQRTDLCTDQVREVQRKDLTDQVRSFLLRKSQPLQTLIKGFARPPIKVSMLSGKESTLFRLLFPQQSPIDLLKILVDLFGKPIDSSSLRSQLFSPNSDISAPVTPSAQQFQISSDNTISASQQFSAWYKRFSADPNFVKDFEIEEVRPQRGFGIDSRKLVLAKVGHGLVKVANSELPSTPSANSGILFLTNWSIGHDSVIYNLEGCRKIYSTQDASNSPNDNRDGPSYAIDAIRIQLTIPNLSATLDEVRLQLDINHQVGLLLQPWH